MTAALQWDIFCKVIDNFGDIGVCWRLAADLAARGQQVRLWVDDASALEWMAPAGCDGVSVMPWSTPFRVPGAALEAGPPDVLIEAFGCEIAPEFIANHVRQTSGNGQKTVWINLEYLSAEGYVERCHTLASPVQSGTVAGWTKWFFYPGFTGLTGGLLREPDLAQRQAKFNRHAWLTSKGIGYSDGEKLVSLFCYEPPALGALLAQLAESGLQGQPTRLLVASGRAAQAVKTVINNEKGFLRNRDGYSLLSISYLPALTQIDFDDLLWACDLNFVRGEDSLVRALWAGKPFVWQIYPQSGNAHLDKLDAFLNMLEAPPLWRAFHSLWNGSAAAARLESGETDSFVLDLPAWQASVLAARQRLMAQDDLTTRLLEFAAKKR